MSQAHEDVLIQVEKVSKKYCRSLKRSLWYGTQDVVRSFSLRGASAAMDPFAKPPLRVDEFWALQDLSFSVARGECLGLIGPNGAGKSTILKILNGLNVPDSGRVTMRGRVGALIELSAGFNPILTGRENIYNQAALLRFTKAEVDKKFDEIVVFSELEEFLDMPVQNYSSGMRVKLGFAISSQLEPDILLIDEVLAVGDVGFRFKCLSRIAELQQKCALIFVSHSMPQIMRISSKLMVLMDGKSISYGTDLAAGLESYFSQFSAPEMSSLGSGEIRVTSLQANTELGECGFGETVSAEHGGKLTLSMNVESGLEQGAKIVLQVLFWNQELIPVLDSFGGDSHGFEFEAQASQTLTLSIDSLPLNAGKFSVSIIMTGRNFERIYCQIDNTFHVVVRTGNSASGAGCLTNGVLTVVPSPKEATGEPLLLGGQPPVKNQ